MNNNLVELTQEEIQEVAGAGYVSDIVGLIGSDVVTRLEDAIVKFSENTQARLNERGNTWLAGLVKIIV
jgi:hypothetical protein